MSADGTGNKGARGRALAQCGLFDLWLALFTRE